MHSDVRAADLCMEQQLPPLAFVPAGRTSPALSKACVGSLDYPTDCSSGSGAGLTVAVSGTAMTPSTRIRSQSVLCNIVGISTLGWDLFNLTQPRKRTSPQPIRSNAMEHGQSPL